MEDLLCDFSFKKTTIFLSSLTGLGQDRKMNTLFDPDIQDEDLLKIILQNKFVKIGEGFSAHVFGAIHQEFVLKIFPNLTVGNPEDVAFIKENIILRKLDEISSRLQNYRFVKWSRQKVKLLLSISQYSKKAAQKDGVDDVLDVAINGYEICIQKGLMNNFPTRVIPNCFSLINANFDWGLGDYYKKPEKIIFQKKFSEEDLLLWKIKQVADRGDIDACKKYINDAINYQVYLWSQGVADTDMSFNIFENIIVLRNEKYQVHDANDITDKKPIALWFIREKEKDLSNLFIEKDRCNYNNFLHSTVQNGVIETVRKLSQIIPKKHREEIINHFLSLSKKTLCEEHFENNWVA